MSQIVTCSRCGQNYAIGGRTVLHSCLGPPNEMFLLVKKLEEVVADSRAGNASNYEVEQRVTDVAEKMRKLLVP